LADPNAMTDIAKTSHDAPSHTEILGAHIAALNYDDIPPAIQQKLKTCLLYGLVMAVTASGIDTLERAALAANDAPGDANTLVSGYRRSAADASYVNALRMCSRGQNDTFSDIYAHPGCITIPVVLALAQQQRASGQLALTAMAAAYETLHAVASGYAPSVLKRGLRATSAFGIYASTAAAARMMSLDAAQTAHALGLATQHSAGTMQCWTEGSPEWRIQVANAARAGITCATLARNGYTSARYALEGDSGFYRAFVGMQPSPPPLAPPAPWTWHTQEVVFKPLPGCLINQAPLFLLLSMQREHGFTANDVASMTVALSERNATYPGIAHHGPFDTPTGAIMSGPFMLAVGLRDGTLRTPDFDAMHGPDDIHALSQRITVTGDPTIPDWGAALTVHLTAGQSLSASLSELSRFAFSWEETDRQLSTLAPEWPWRDAPARYIHLKSAIQSLHQAPSVNALMEATCPQNTSIT
jgi:2-methylcitrate dehydratase PrpD